MGKGLDLAAVRVERRLDDCLAVARCHRPRNVRALGHHGIELFQRVDDGLQGRAMITAVGRMQQLFVTADGDKLCRCRACVDADADRTAIVRKNSALYAVTIMPCTERRIVLCALKECEIGRACLCRRSLLRTCNTRLHLPHIDCFGLI